MEEQLCSDQGDSSPASSQGSARQECQVVEEPDLETSGAQPKMPLPGFKEITESLMGDDPPGTTTNIPQGLASPGFLVGSAVATMTSTVIHQDELTGNIYMNTVMTSMGLINLETPLVAVDCQMLTLVDVTNMDMADIHPK